MICEKVLSYLETGNVFTRAIAQRHVARCDDCAQVVQAFSAVKAQLRRTDPLTSKDREIWQGACAPIEHPAPVRIGFLAIPTVCLAILLGAVAFIIFDGPSEPSNGEIASSAIDIKEARFDVTADLAHLENQLALLEDELDQLERDADLIEARRQLNQILADFEVW